jgi:hypothetical protein
MKKATITQEISVRHSIRPDVRREFLEIDVDGWDEVKKLTKKVLKFDGKDFVFSGWNSDSNHCYFFRPLEGSVKTARIV